MNAWVMVLIVVLVILAFGGVGFYGHREPRNWGAYGWSPLGIVLIVLLCLWLTGNLHGCAVPR